MTAHIHDSFGNCLLIRR